MRSQTIIRALPPFTIHGHHIQTEKQTKFRVDISAVFFKIGLKIRASHDHFITLLDLFLSFRASDPHRVTVASPNADLTLLAPRFTRRPSLRQRFAVAGSRARSVFAPLGAASEAEALDAESDQVLHGLPPVVPRFFVESAQIFSKSAQIFCERPD